MFSSELFLFGFLFMPVNLQDFPSAIKCVRPYNENNFWWDINTTGNRSCEILRENEDMEECGECLHFKTWGKENACNHIAFVWKWSYYKVSGKSFCTMKDYCKSSWYMTYKKYFKNQYGETITGARLLNYVCGTEDQNGTREQRGECKSVYGTYNCDCKKPFQGKDCMDLGPDGAYATGVQVILNPKARVSEMFTILIAAKEKGNDLKVHIDLTNVYINHAVPPITFSKPIIDDSSSIQLIEYCRKNTGLKSQCDTYLKGWTYLYRIQLRFPFLRVHPRLSFYEEEKNSKRYLSGYFTNFTITTTNSINGIEKDSFYRTNFDKIYEVFVQYPSDTGCYKNIHIVNCIELQEKVNIYDASQEIVLHGDTAEIEVEEVSDLECIDRGDNTITWTVSQLTHNGTFIPTIFESKAKSGLKFIIKPYSFDTGTYVVEFSYTVLTPKAATENIDQCFFKVEVAPVIAIIEDGTGRYVDVDTVVVLDGSGSYDPNVEVESNNVGLNFEWSCILNQTGETCLVDYIGPTHGSRDIIKLPISILEPGKEYIINLIVSKNGRKPAYASQTLFTGRERKILSVGINCVNCMEGNIANPTEFIYLLVKVVLKDTDVAVSSLSYNWTFSTYPEYPPIVPTETFRVNKTSEFLLKVDKKTLQENKTYSFRATVEGEKDLFSETDVRIPFSSNFTCNITPNSGTIAVTDFIVNCTSAYGLTYEVFDKLTTDPNYYNGRMLFTGFDPHDNYFKLANQKVVVYSFNKYKMIQEWVYEIKLKPFDGHLKDINNMLLNLDSVKFYPQRLLHSASVIPGALKLGIEWSPIHLLKRLINVIHGVKLQTIQDTKLVLSSIEFILFTMSKNNTRNVFKLQVEEAKMCADIIFALSSTLFEYVKTFDVHPTLTDTILQQMINSHINVIEIILSVKNADVLTKPLHLVNPHILYKVKDTTYALVDALYKLSSSLLWRQIQGDSATEIISTGLEITEWAIVRSPEELYHLRKQNQSIPFNFSVGFYHILQHVDTLGIQVTQLNVNPFWWAGGDINTNILLVDICFKIKLRKCKYHRTFYKAPIFLYFDISLIYSLIKPLEIHTVHLNLTKDPRDLDVDITVYRFDPPLRAKLFIQFEFQNTTDNFRVLFCENERPDFEMIHDKGITINNENKSMNQQVIYKRDGRDKLYYMGIFPVHKGVAGKRVKFKLKILFAVCKTWLRWKWGNQRCWVGEQETNERTLRCDCNHLSMFAGAVQVPSYTLNPAMEFMLFLTEEFNWLPLIVLIVIILICIILYAWGWLKDRKDSKKGLVTVLEDNYPGERYAYLIGVYTGSRLNARTKAKVGIKLFGENWKTRAHILNNSNHPTLRGNSDDWFLLYTPEHLGTLESLHIWHDNSGKSPDWFVENIEVYDLTDKLKYIFEFNMWLALTVDENPEAVSFPSGIQDFYSVKRVFLSNVVTGFRDTNYWTSIFWKHERNPIKRVYRITVVLCYVLVAMVSSILIYYYNEGEGYKEDSPSYSFDNTDFVIFTITFLTASFTSCLLMFLFRKSYSHRHIYKESSLFFKPEDINRMNSFYSSKRNDYGSQIYVSKNLEKLSVVSLFDSTSSRYIQLTHTNLDGKYLRLGLRSKLPCERNTYENFVAAVHASLRGSTLNPVRLPQYRSNVIVHKKYFITVWLLFLIIIPCTTAVVLLFGHRILQVESKKWLSTWLSAILFDALIVSTIKILLCSAILACFFQRVVPESNYQIKAEDGMNENLVGDNKYLFKLAQSRINPMYFPLHEHLKAIYRNKCIRKEQRRVFIDFLWVLMLILVLVMLNAVYTVNYYTSNTHVVRMLTKDPSYKYHNFTNVYNRTLYTNFLFYNFIDRLHRYLWYNQEDPLNDNDHLLRRRSWTNDCTMRLLGNVRIRQLRIVLGECSVVRYFEEMAEHCSPPWSSSVEDTGTYSSRWYIRGSDPVNRKSTAWRYTGVVNSNSTESYGITLTLYPSGGFIEDLGFEKDDNEDSLASLFPQNWLDHSTRAVFVELTLYNVNTRLFTQVILVAEHMPSGEYLVILKANSVNTKFNFDIWKVIYFGFFVFFLVRMCFQMNRRGLFVYFSKIINVYELFLLTLGGFTISFYLVHIKFSSDYVHEFQRSGVDEFFNFLNIVSYSNLSRTVLCILFICLIVRLFISLRLGRVYFTLFYTIFLSMPWILWLILYFILYLLILRRFISFLLNLFVFPYRSSVIVFHKDWSAGADEGLSYKVLVYLSCLSSYIVLLLFIASFVYYFKVAKVYKLIDTDKLNFFLYLKETIKKRSKH